MTAERLDDLGEPSLLLPTLREPHLEQRQLPLDVIGAGHVHDIDDIDQLAEMFRNLIDDRLRARRDDREPRDGLIIGRGHVEALDVEASGRE